MYLRLDTGILVPDWYGDYGPGFLNQNFNLMIELLRRFGYVFLPSEVIVEASKFCVN